MGDVSLQKRSDLARIPLNLPHFSKTSLVTSQVFKKSCELRVSGFEFSYPEPATRNPKQLPNTYHYKCHQPPSKSVKTRRKSLVSNKVYLQIGETINFTTETQRAQRKTKKINNSNKGKEDSIWHKKTGLPGRTKPHLGSRPCLCGRLWKVGACDLLIICNNIKSVNFLETAAFNGNKYKQQIP
jgi:hypothetical protein